MRPIDHSWRLLKRYVPYGHTSLPASAAAKGGVTRMPRPTPPAANYAALANLTDEELERMAAESERIYREEMRRQYYDDLERRIDAGEVTPTDVFDEGGNAAAGAGYISGGRQY